MSKTLNNKSTGFARSLKLFRSKSESGFSELQTQFGALQKRLAGDTDLSPGDIDDIKNKISELEKSLKKQAESLATGSENLIRNYDAIKNRFSILDDKQENLKILYDLISALDSETDLEKLMKFVIESLAKIINAE